MNDDILPQAAKSLAEKKRRTRWHRAVSFMAAIVVFITTYALILPAITMERAATFSVGTIGANTAMKTVTWDTVQKKITSLSFNVNSTTKDWFYTLQHSPDGGVTWTPPNPTSTASGIKATADNQVIALDGASTLNNLTPDSVFRVYGYKGNKANESGYTAGLTIYDVLGAAKPGFSQWLDENYADFGGTTPTDMNGLYAAFELYYAQPVASLTQALRDGNSWLDATVTPAGSYTYHWQYKDENGVWQELTIAQTASVNASDLEAILNGGKTVRARIMQGETLVTISNPLVIDPRAQVRAAAITAINTQLGLATYNIGNAKTADLTISGNRFNKLFYYGNVNRDNSVPFRDAATYSDYLAETYLSGGIDAVRSVWNYYLYDLYDPSFDKDVMKHIIDYPEDYPEAGTYGDGTFNWPKDADRTASSPFHAAVAPAIVPLNYDFLENGVDYGNFVTDLDKSATAAAAGDLNSQRRYNIEITADAQAKVKAPVVLVFQIQTSWQMFDLAHANRLKTDLPVNGTNVGAAANNTAMANLYDIKQALLRLVDYMEENYPGNNLAMAITDVEHAGTFSMFNGTDVKGNPLYVTNDPEKLREGIIGWDTFGNCEHVHYGSLALQNAVNNLVSNLSGWKDFYGTSVGYGDIQKVGVILGGPTENSTGTSGYGITLPWGTFQSAKLNSVYGIRTNEGTPLNSDGLISWIDSSGNNTGASFKDGAGTSFTDKYIASNEDAMFSALLDIVQREMNTKGMEVTAEEKYVDNVVVRDTVTNEFFVNKAADITATILNKDGSVQSTKVISLEGAQVQRQSNGTVITTTADGLVITEKPDGTTDLQYNFGQVHNTKKAVLRFQVEARETYIGSNTVFTNVGTPKLDYEHHKMDGDGNLTGVVDSYDIGSMDTPQVNVPIRFNTVDGLTSNLIVGDSVNLSSLSEAIVQDAQDRVDNHPQTNGTLSYVWVLPNGSEVPAGSVTVIGGSIGDASFPDRSSVFNATTAGAYTGTLKVTFTPNAVDSANKNFSDAATKTAVNPLTKPGQVWINVIPPDAKTDFIVRKEWPNGPGDHLTVDFHLLANGTAVLDQHGQPVRYQLTAENDWVLRLTGLPMTRMENGTNVVVSYSVEEALIPEGFRVSYRKETQTETSYAAKAILSFTFAEDVKDDKTVTINYKYAGKEMRLVLGSNQHVKFNKNTSYSFEVPDLPLDANGNPSPISIVSVVSDDKKTLSSSSANTVKYVTGSVYVPVAIMTNERAFRLPDTGGTGTIPYTVAGVLLMAGAGLMYKKKLFRKGGRDSP
ncbi:TPA: LPXTG cell wall anchor domain-containing protein [Streptococcus suis]